MVEASMWRKQKRISQVLHDLIVTKLGDNDIKSTTFTSKGSKIDPVLRLFPGAPNDVHFKERPKEGEGQLNNMQVCVCQIEA